jgi:hypothetical protein
MACAEGWLENFHAPGAIQKTHAKARRRNKKVFVTLRAIQKTHATMAQRRNVKSLCGFAPLREI